MAARSKPHAEPHAGPRPTAKPRPHMPAPRGEVRLGHRLFMLGLIAGPFVVLTVLVYGILISFETGPSMVAEPVGAGAGDSGGANAIGEALFGHGDTTVRIPAEETARGAALIVRDASGRADGAHPIVVLTNHGQWSPQRGLRMERRADSLWYLRLPPPEAGDPDPLAFRFVILGDAGEALREFDDEGEPVGDRRLPRVTEEEAVGETPLEYTFTVQRFGE